MGITQPSPAGGLGGALQAPQGRQTHFGNNLLKIGWSVLLSCESKEQ